MDKVAGSLIRLSPLSAAIAPGVSAVKPQVGDDYEVEARGACDIANAAGH